MSARPMEQDDSNGPRSGFRAVLQDRQLADLMQIECLTTSKGAVRVSSGSNVGYLFFDSGRVVHAVTRNSRGEAAVLEMLAWEGGTFEPTAEPPWPQAPTIECSVQSLVLRAAIARDHVGAADGSVVRQAVSAQGVVLDPPGPRALHASTDRQAVKSVRVDCQGTVVDCTEEGADYAPVAAYVSRMAGLVGQALGVKAFSSLECVSPDGQCAFVCVCPDGTLVGATAERDCELARLRRRLRSEGAPV